MWINTILAALNAGTSPSALNIPKTSSLDDVRDSSSIGTYYQPTYLLTYLLTCAEQITQRMMWDVRAPCSCLLVR